MIMNYIPDQSRKTKEDTIDEAKHQAVIDAIYEMRNNQIFNKKEKEYWNNRWLNGEYDNPEVIYNRDLQNAYSDAFNNAKKIISENKKGNYNNKIYKEAYQYLLEQERQLQINIENAGYWRRETLLPVLETIISRLEKLRSILR